MALKPQEEVGDLFVTERELLLKLLPSNKTATKRIRWFLNGAVTDHQEAVEDIAGLVARIKGKTRIVRGLTLMTHHGPAFDLAGSGLSRAVERAGFSVLR